jgi:hypothetical protein
MEFDRVASVNATVRSAMGKLRAFVRSLKVSIGDVEFGFDVPAEPGATDSGDLEADLPELFVAVAEAARACGTGVAILVDELQYLSSLELSALIMALHRSTQRNLPLVFVGAGLPQLVGQMGDSKSYAERLLDFPAIGALPAADASRALSEPARAAGVAFEADALRAIVSETEGYPFFLQEWGYQAWNAAEGSPIRRTDVEQASKQVIRRLDQSFFRVRFDRLTPAERRYMRAMAELGRGPHRSGDIAAKLGMKITSVGPLRGGLIRKGMVFSPSHGDTAFTVPLFDQFMRRAMPLERVP